MLTSNISLKNIKAEDDGVELILMEIKYINIYVYFMFHTHTNLVYQKL